jgi:NAD(P)-dependent dehydrogenase (short-subunit alcohol dehydrogenase family)
VSDSSPPVLVTGASRGIGAAVVEAALEFGWEVVAMSRSDIEQREGVHRIPVDLADQGSRNAALDRLLAEHGLPEVVFDCAGAFLLARLENTSDALLREQLAINLEAPFALARKLLPLMRARGSGRHIMIGSVADQRAFPENGAYSAAKFGLRGLHAVLVEEFRGTGVLCTLISPGPTDTTVWDPIDPDSRPGFLSRSQMLTADEVAQAAIWAAIAPRGVHIESIRMSPDRPAGFGD